MRLRRFVIAVALAVSVAWIGSPTLRAGTLSSVAPAGASGGVSINITGTGFDPAAANNLVTFTSTSGVSVTAQGTAVLTLDQTSGLRRLTVTVPDGLPPGTTTLLVQNKITQETSAGKSIEYVTLALPDATSGAPGASGLAVRITGSPNAAFAPGTRVSLGTGVTVTSTTIQSPTSLIATVTIAAGAALGARDVNILSGTQTLLLRSGFYVQTQPVNHAPTGSAGGPYTGTAGQPIAFAGSGTDPDNDPLTFTWNFGDGTAPASGSSATHTYAQAGDFTATLTISDGRGGSVAPTAAVHVVAANRAPTGSAGGPYSGTAGQPIAFTGSGTDPDNDPLTFTWNFGDGTAPASGSSATHTYAQAGDFTATLTISDSRGGSVAPTAAVHVVAANRAPTGSAGGPYSGTAGQPIAFTGSGTDPDNDPLTFTWNFGDGTAPASGSSATHTYAQAGDFTATLAISDGRGGSVAPTAAVHIVAANRAPTGSAGGPYTGTAGQPIAFAGSGTDPDNDPLTFTWNFGDGTAPASGSSATHTYAQAGDFTATLTISDSRGGSVAPTAAVHIVAANRAPTGSAGGPYGGTAGQPIAFTGSGTDPDNDPLTFTWNFGDGTAPASGSSATHTYVQAGDFTATLTISDGRGGSVAPTATVHVVLTNAAPTATAGGPYNGSTRQAVQFAGAANDPDNDPLTLTWDFGDGSTGTGATPTHTYAAPGSYTAAFRADDGRGGLVTATSAVTIVFVNQPPAFTSAPVTSAKPQVDYAYQAIATDPDNDALTYSLPQAPAGMTIGAPTGLLAWSPGTLQLGQFSVTIVATDSFGASTPQSFSIVVADMTPPVVHLSLPLQALPGAAVTATALADDNVGVTSVTLQVNGADPIEQANPPYSRLINVPADAVVGTEFHVQAIARDAVGNTGTADAIFKVAAVPDTTPPVVSLNAPSQAAPGTTIRLSAATSDNVGVKALTFKHDTSTLDPLSDDPDQSSFTIPADAVIGSSLGFSVRAIDFSDNFADAVASVVVVAAPDTTPPHVQIVAPTTIDAGGTLILSATADDDVGVASVEFLVDGASVGIATGAPFGASFKLPASATGGDVLHAQARAVDFSGNAAAADAQTSVLASPDRAPVANAGGPYSGETGALIAFSAASSSDPDAGDQLTYDWNFGDGFTGSGVGPNHAYATPGPYMATVTVGDGRGSVNSATAAIQIVAATDHNAPSITLTGPLFVLPGDQVTITAQASDDRGVAGVTFSVNGSDTTDTSTAPYQRIVNVPAVAAPDDHIAVHATARDAAGNQSSADALLTISATPDTTAPAVALHAPPQVAAGASLHVSATVTDDVGVQDVMFSVNGSPIADLPAPPYEITYTVPADASAGSSVGVVVDAFDFNHNHGTTNASVTVTAVSSADTVPPTVTLAAPLQVFEGKTLTLSAVAADNVGVASVELTVNGVSVATLTSSPYSFDYHVGPTQTAGAVLKIQAKATDFSGLQGVASAQTLVVSAASAGQGTLTGEVYDDGSSLPLVAAAVKLVGTDNTGTAYTQATTTDARGRWVLHAAEGKGVVQITKTGWTEVDRPATVAVDQAIELFDARLTGVGGTPQSISAVLGGSISSGQRTLTLPAGALATATTLSLTAPGPQGLQGLLPPGWSPAAVADIAPHGLAFSVPAQLTAANSFNVGPGSTLTIARWDEQDAAWKAVGVLSVVQGQPFAASIASSGQYAFLLADTPPAAPPLPAPGDTVGGVSLVALSNDVVTLVDPQPRILFYAPGVKSDVHGTITSPAQIPSGLPIEARLSESYQFLGGTELHPDSSVEDLVFYQLAAPASGLTAALTVTPSQTFDPLTLQLGTITVELLAPPLGARVVTAVSGDGGAAASTTGETLQVPQGATSDSLPVSIVGLTAANLGVTLPPGVDLAGAALVTFSGSLVKAAALQVPRPSGTTDASQLLLVRAQDIGGQTRLVLVGRARIVGNQIVSDTTLNGVSDVFEGVRVPGRYLFVHTSVPIGFANGNVIGSDGSQLAGGLVSVSTLPLVALSATGGAYVAVAATGAVTATALDLQRSDVGTAAGTIASSGAVIQLDLRIVAALPQVTAITPADGASNVPLSNPIVVRFSRPVDPASVNGQNAGNVIVAGPDGTPVAGSVSLSDGNTVLTLRPGATLQASTTYTITVGTGVADANGRHLTAAVTAHFASLNTSPPPTPAAGSIAASVPGGDGFTTVTATQGTAGTHDTVTIVNLTQKTTTPVLLDPNGGFSVRVAAGITDQIQIAITGANGTQTVVPIQQFRQTNADGSVSAAVGAQGGMVEGPNGTAVEVANGTFPSGAVVTVKSIPESAFPIALDANGQSLLSYAGGIQLDFGGQTPQHYLNVFVPAGPDDKPTDQWLVNLVRDNNGTPVLNVVDTAKLISGRVRTSSPPCPGVTGAGVYGVYKSKSQIGVSYAQMNSTGFGGLQMTAQMLTDASPIPLPWMSLDSLQTPQVCYPVLTGNVTISPNAQTITVPGSQLHPADREIVIHNTTLVSEIHYPHNVAELRYDVPGKITDSFTAAVVDGAGVQTLAASIDVQEDGLNQVAVRLDADTIKTSVAQVVITNATQNIIKPFSYPEPDLNLSASGGASDSFEVDVVDANGVPRKLDPTPPVTSPAGTGHLVVRASTGTIDPSQAEIDAYNSTHPTTPITGPGRSSVELFEISPNPGGPSTVASLAVIPASVIVTGGFAYAFDGDPTKAHNLVVRYDNGAIDDVDFKIQTFQITVANRTTGRVIKTITAPAPPRDQPLDLGPLSDDTEPPILTSGPARMTSFDPSGIISFTFSEAMNADSLKSGIIVERVEPSGNRIKVSGEIRVSDGNTVATFVPDTPLAMATEYSITFVGGDALGAAYGNGASPVTDRSNNALATARFKLTTFKPRVVGTFQAELDRSNLPIELKDVEIRRKPDPIDPNKTKTYAVMVADPRTPDYRLLALDVSDPSAPARLAPRGTGSEAIGGSGKKRILLLPDLGTAQFPAMTVRNNPPLTVAKKCDGSTTYTAFVGDLALAPSWNTSDSYLSIFDITDLQHPCLTANKTFTANPDTLSSFDAPGTVHEIGYASHVATVQKTNGYEAYVSVENVGLFAADLGQNIPEQLPAERVKEPEFAGDYWDVVNVSDKLLAANHTDSKLDLLGPDFSLLGSVALPAPPRRLVTVTGYGVDKNEDGLITPNEQFDLAFVAVDSVETSTHSIVVVDITDPDKMSVVGEIPMPGIVRELAPDPVKHRLFAGGDRPIGATAPQLLNQSLFMVDAINPFQSGLTDADSDGMDDRIIWHHDYPSGVNGFRLDDKRGLLYVTSVLGLDLWAVYDACCDLGVDMTMRPPERQTGNRGDLLQKEAKALAQEIDAGLQVANTDCGLPLASIAILEQGSGACLWKKDKSGMLNPLEACGATYQPGLSDHDYEVLFPASVPVGIQSCTVKTLDGRFTDDEGNHKVITIQPDGSTISFDDITFFPFSREDFANAKLNVAPPPASTPGDATGDIGLGRQQLLLLWLLGGEYVPLTSVGPGPSLDTLLDRLRNVTGISRLEGFEWATLQSYNLAKSKALLRFAGASDPTSSLHPLYVKQLHDAAKAGIRSAFGRLIADTEGNRLAQQVARHPLQASGSQVVYETNACLGVSPTITDPNQWPARPCTSFEEYAASAVARTLVGPEPLGLFTLSDVLQVYRFYQVKADEVRIISEAEADTFMAGVAQFLDKAKTITAPIYNQLIGSDPDAAQRTMNRSTADTKRNDALQHTTVVLNPHAFSRGFQSGDQIQVALYETDAAQTGTQVATTRVDLDGGDDRYFGFAHNPDGSLKLDPNGDPVPIFQLGPIDVTQDLGVVHGRSFTIDLPDHKMKEADRENNVGGFFFYNLDPGNPVRPTIPSAPYVPLSDPDATKPDPECDTSPELKLTQHVIIGGQTLDDYASIPLGKSLTIQLTVTNLSGDTQDNVTVCSNITKACYSAGTLAVGQTQTITVPFSAPTTGAFFDGAPTAYSDEAGIVMGGAMRLTASCNDFSISPLAPDPNPQSPATPDGPDNRTVMRGGKAVRYFRVYSPDTFDPLVGAAVTVTVSGPGGTRTLNYTTDAYGFIVGTADLDPASIGCDISCMAIPFDASFAPDTTYTATIASVNGVPLSCQAPITFDVKVLDREFSRVFNAGASIQAEATAAIGPQAKLGSGIGATKTERDQQGPQKLALTRTVNASAGLQVGGGVGADFNFGGLVQGQIGGKAKGGISGTLIAGTTHEFKYASGATDLATPESTALGGLMLATLAQSGVGNVFASKMVEEFVANVSGYDNYKTSSTFSVGIDATAGANLGVIAGLAPFNKNLQQYGSLDYGVEAGAAVSGTASATIGVELRPIDVELVPQYQLKAGIDLSGALGIGAIDTSWNATKQQNALKMMNKLSASFKTTRSGTWTAKLTLDPSDFTLKKLTISIGTVKDWGWKAGGSAGGSGGGLVNGGAGGNPDQVTETYTITDPDTIQKAIDSLESIAGLNGVVSGPLAAGTGVLLGPTVLVGETVNLFALLSESNASYAVALQRGGGVELPFEIGLGAGARAKLGASIKFDRSVTSTTEKAVILGGQEFTLEQYVPDSLIPTPPADLSDLQDLLQTGIDAASNFGAAAISTVQTNVVSGINSIRSLLTAQLDFDGATAGTSQVALSSFHFNEIPGPVASTPYRPADSSGPAGRPHYGVGGFHQFLPQDTVLGAPATLTFFYEPAEATNIDVSTLQIYAWNDDAQDWSLVGGTVDPVARTITTTVNKLALYTASPAMPAGTIAFTSTSTPNGIGVNATTTITYTSGAILMNNGAVIPDGTLFTVYSLEPGADTSAFGTITSPDENPADGIQVSSHGGQIQFTTQVPGTTGVVKVLAYSQEGTALATQFVPYHP